MIKKTRGGTTKAYKWLIKEQFGEQQDRLLQKPGCLTFSSKSCILKRKKKLLQETQTSVQISKIHGKRNGRFSGKGLIKLGSLDGCRYYFYDVGWKIFSRRQMDGGLMLRVTIDYKERLMTINSENYLDLINEQLRQHGTDINGEK